MQIKGDKITFKRCDMKFVEKFGIEEAYDMVLDFKNVCSHPFIYDTYQLADFFGLERKDLFLIVRKCNKSYTEIKLRKRNGGIRTIDSPSKTLKYIQRKILKEILDTFPVSKYATAYRKGRQLSDNATVHCGKKYLLKMDLSDFFGSIRFYQVYNAAFNTSYFPKQIGVMLTALCCKDDVLPQGAPTSPALSNLVLRHFDDTMGYWCKKNNLSYTRYCDDITFSGNKPLYRTYVKAKSLLEAMGFELNEKKTRFITSANRQAVTGLTVNEKVRVNADYKREVRKECYYAIKHGIENAIIYGNRTDFIKDGTAEVQRYYNHLTGRIRYILQIEPGNKYFKEALNDLRKLKV